VNNLGLFDLKWLIIVIIFAASVASGFVTLRIAHKYKKWISTGEALASGIFIGAAFFHLLPAATTGFMHSNIGSPLLDALLLAILSFILLMALEHYMTQKMGSPDHFTRLGPLILTLSIHAFLTGIALGISTSYLVIITLLIAIIAHKAFEMFALVINLHRNMKHNQHIRWLFIAFSFVTPFGILIGGSNQWLALSADSSLTAYINAICAGTFIYIATIHTHHGHHPHADGYQKYVGILATLTGMGLMGLLAFWI
jgi:hypothetical protein